LPVTTSENSTTTLALTLPNHQLIEVEVNEKAIQLSDEKHHLNLEGSFADAIRSLIDTQSSSNALKYIENQHAWLAGLSQAKVITATDSQLLLGAGLGMLFIELTSQCNERCIHCYADSSPQRNDFLSFSAIQHALEQAAQLGQSFVQFTGGDPLIHPKLVEATAYAHQLGLKDIEIYTNGLLLHPPLLEQLKTYKPRFCFSIFSHDEAVLMLLHAFQTA